MSQNRTRTVDERVVEMRFDNKQFESGAKQSMNTLTRLKEALKLPDSAKALEGIDEATKNISLDGISAGVDALNARFSTLGIVGIRVIENITDGLMNRLNKAIGFVSDSIISGGIRRAMNIENAHFQLQALLKDETKVQAVMADAMESVDGTAYAYDEAAKAAAQFSASGIQAGEEMLGALKGITGVAAMTNSRFEDISMIFTTVAGNGRLMGDQLLQLSSRGLNVASTLADYFKEVRGQAGMTEGTIREMVTKGQISFKDFSDAMTWAFGDSAKRANETFTGALSNMKSALARIGAGFISPFVEQNGELVQLFNALRIKINDVKTSLVFDEQKSAIEGMTEKVKVLNETYAEMLREGKLSTESFVESLMKVNEIEDRHGIKASYLQGVFDQLKEDGKVTVSMLNGMSNAGVDATAAIREYVNGIHNGTIKASDDMKKMADDLSSSLGKDAFILSEKQIKQFAKEGKIDFELLSEALVRTNRDAIEAAGGINEALSSMFKEVKENGSLSIEMLQKFSKNGIDAEKAVREYMKGVRDGSIRATYATKSAIDEMTDGVVVTTATINKLAEEGKISADIFTSAMEHSFGKSTSATKQFSDFFQDMIHKVVVAINETDMTKPMETFYYGLESFKNLLKGLYSVLSPVGKAFADVFLDFNGDDVIIFASAIETLTAKMRLSERGSKNLHDGFEGVFSVVKLLVDVFFELFGAIVPINKPIIATGGGLLELIGIVGRGLTWFTKMIRSCTLLRKAFGVIPFGINLAMDSLSKLIKMGNNVLASIQDLEIVKNVVGFIEESFISLEKEAGPYIDSFVSDAQKMIKEFVNLDDVNADEILNVISDALSKFVWEIQNFSFDKASADFDGFIDKIKDLAMSNEGFATFVKNMKEFADNFKETFNFDNTMSRLEKVMSVFEKFFNWIKKVFGPTFEDFSIGSTIAGAGGIGIIYALVKGTKSLEKITGSLSSITGVFGALKGTLIAYQKDLKAAAILKVAGAIAILAGALVLLSFADPKRLLSASIALGVVAGVLLFGIIKLLDSINKGKEVSSDVNTFSKGLSASMKNLTKALKIKAIGGAVKNFAVSIAIIAGSIIALGLMYEHNPEAFEKAIDVITKIGLFLAAIGLLVGIGSKFVDAKGMTAIGKSVLMVSASLTLIIMSIDKLMRLKIPEDYKIKFKILGGIIAGLGGLAVVLALAARISGGNQLPNMAKTIKSLAILMFATVMSIWVLFKMDLPNDYQRKLDILKDIFLGFAGLLVAMGVAARLSGGSGLKAAGTILAMSAFLVVVVGSLFVLSLIPADKMLKGATALGGILITLGIALAGASKITNAKSYMSIMAMAATVGVIVASLSVLSLIQGKKLLTAVTALGTVLLTLALDFYTVSKVDVKKATPIIFEMIVAALSIAVALYALAQQPWKSLLAAGGALSATLLSIALAFKIINESKLTGTTKPKLKLLGELIAAAAVIAVSLYALAQQPWNSLLAAGTAMSATLLALALAFNIINESKMSGGLVSKLELLAALVIATVPIAAELYILAQQPWDSLLAAAGSLSMVLIALSASFWVLSNVKADPATLTTAILGFVGFVTVVGVLMTALGALFTEVESLESYLDKGVDILIKIGEGLGRFIGSIIEGVIAQASAALPEIGDNLSKFWISAELFFTGIGTLPDETFDKIGKLSLALMALTVAELVSGIASLIGSDFQGMGMELSNFMIAATPFFDGLNMIKPESMEAAKNIAGMILALTAASVLEGIAGIFGLSGSFSDFGTELEAFGPSIKQFAEDVKDVKPEAVEGAAAAAQIMADMASTLPNSGGLAAKILGDNKLSDFGDELAIFGPSIAQFAEDVKNVKPEAVEGAASAAKIMSEMANNLPNSGGLAALILGDNRISDFGAELVLFGPMIKQFAEDVKDIKPEAVQGAASAAQMLVDLSNNLENSGGLVSWFTGDNTLDTFGEQLVKFGEAMSDFSGTLDTVNVDQMNSAVENAKKLIDLATYATGISATDLVKFVNSLDKISADALSKFISQFNDSQSKVADSINVFVKYAIDALQAKLPDFKIKGTESANQYIQGIREKYNDAFSAGEFLAMGASNGLVSLKGKFNIIGSDAGSGFIEGMRSKIEDIGKAAAEMGKTAYESSKNALDEHSPSKKMGEVGENAGLGFINQLMLYIVKAKQTGEEIGKATISGISLVMTDDISDPVIRPSVDLTDVNSSFGKIRDQFNEAISSSAELATSVSATMNVKRTTEKEESINRRGDSIVNVKYEQTINSPKYVSALDVYRNTNNQLSRLKSSLKGGYTNNYNKSVNNYT